MNVFIHNNHDYISGFLQHNKKNKNFEKEIYKDSTDIASTNRKVHLQCLLIFKKAKMYEPHKVFNFETEFMINITIEDITYKLKYIHIYHGIQEDYLPN